MFTVPKKTVLRDFMYRKETQTGKGLYKLRLDQFQSKDEAIAYIQENVYGCANVKHAEKYLREHIPLESDYQKKIIQFLKKEYPTAFVWKAAAGAYSRQGIPDVCFIKDGRYFGFEVKRPYFGEPTKMQKDTIRKIREAGGIAAAVCFPEEVQKIVEGVK